MKKIFLLAALALTMAACSNEDNITEQPAEVRGIPFSATITTGGATRALSGPDATTKVITATWAENEEVALVYEVSGVTKVTKATVTAVSDGNDGKRAGTATISARLADGVANGDDITLIYPYSMVDGATGNINDDIFTAQRGTLLNSSTGSDISKRFDLRKGTGKIYYNGTDDATLKENVTMTSQIAIWQLTLNFGADGMSVTGLSTGKTLTISVGDKTYTVESEFDDVGVGMYRPFKSGDVIYLAMLPCNSKPFSISTINGSNELYLYQHPSLSLAAGKYYQSSVAMDKTVPNRTITSADTDVELQNGDMVTGTGGTATHITIADGATVYLAGLNNTAINFTYETPYAGIECLGNAHIILFGSNSVKGVCAHAGISVPSGSTLTISGTGSLTATGDVRAAGIGGNRDASCGNITIKGGTVNAMGGSLAAGIGSGCAFYSAVSCGNISITGGTVSAQGGDFAAGIGSGYADYYAASCGAITISGGTVNATGGERAAAIGSGGGGKFASINITTGITSVIATRSNDDSNVPIGKGNGDRGSGSIAIDDETISDAMTGGTAPLPAFTNLKVEITDGASFTNGTWTITKK